MPADLVAALHAEALKLRRSRVPWATAGAVLLAGAVGAFFMFVLQDVDRARTLGLLGTKAQLTGGTADWAGYFSLTAQTVSVGRLVISGSAAIWLFGREFSDRTATDLLALPTSRTAVVLAKLLLLHRAHGPGARRRRPRRVVPLGRARPAGRDRRPGRRGHRLGRAPGRRARRPRLVRGHRGLVGAGRPQRLTGPARPEEAQVTPGPGGAGRCASLGRASNL
ncbi:ABC transporter permease [Kocuria sp. CPCC 205292]|uniref:ABC transporter permease n=1 Tax=Kocuria cellulosilytica TaxID=3071451 RepID=UPI0034D5509A